MPAQTKQRKAINLVTAVPTLRGRFFLLDHATVTTCSSNCPSAARSIGSAHSVLFIYARQFSKCYPRGSWIKFLYILQPEHSSIEREGSQAFSTSHNSTNAERRQNQHGCCATRNGDMHLHAGFSHWPNSIIVRGGLILQPWMATGMGRVVLLFVFLRNGFTG